MQDRYFEDVVPVFIIAVISLWICSFSLATFGIFLSFCSTVLLCYISTGVSFTLLGKLDYTCDNFWKFSIIISSIISFPQVSLRSPFRK